MSIVFSVPSFANQDRFLRCQSDDPSALQVAIVAKRNTVESDSLKKGVYAACNDTNWRTPINVLKPTEYDENDGFDVISKLVSEGQADVIIGPSESGLYSNLYHFLDYGTTPVPIISPIVTIRLGNEAEGWLFRTNVDAAKRAKVMYDFFSSKNVENFAILYSDSIFGEIAETAFREVLTDIQQEKFTSFRFGQIADSRPWLQQIKQSRPEAIGIIGSRNEVKQFNNLYNRLPESWNKYNPYVFTIVDVRATNLNDVHFLTVAQPNSTDVAAMTGELFALSYDTSSLIFEISDAMMTQGLNPSVRDWQFDFRKRLYGAISGAVLSRPRKSGMDFIGQSNEAEPKVMKMAMGKAVEVEPSADSLEWQAIVNWFEIRKRRFGIAPIVNLLLITSIVALLTVIDLRRQHRVKGRDTFRAAFLLLISFNAGVAMLVFTFSSEQGLSRWDSVLGAIVVAFGYTGILKTTIFQTAAGTSIGIRHYYDNLVGLLNDRIRRQQFEKDGPTINYIAYANSRKYLYETLVESYAFAGGEERKNQLQSELDKQLKKVKSTMEKRKVLAKEVLDELRWGKLLERRIVPHGAKKKGDIRDPEPLVAEAVDHCFKNNIHCLPELEAMVKQRFKEGKYQDLEGEFDEEINVSTTPKSKSAVCIRWLILLDGYDIRRMIAQRLLPADYPLKNAISFKQKWFGNGKAPREKRQSTRVNIAPTKIDLEYQGQHIPAHLQDVSTGGAKIRLRSDAPEIASNVNLSTLSKKACVNLQGASGMVVNIKPSSNGFKTIGIHWHHLSTECKDEINRYIGSILGGMQAT